MVQKSFSGITLNTSRLVFIKKEKFLFVQGKLKRTVQSKLKGTVQGKLKGTVSVISSEPSSYNNIGIFETLI